MITVCPSCLMSHEVNEDKRNTRIFCSGCKDFFMAYEARECSRCGKLKHPNHRCQCGNSDKVFKLTGLKTEIPVLVTGLPAAVADQLEKIFAAVKERIEDLENKVSDLEDEIEELKNQQN